jgi:uncharacterized protein
MRTVRRRISIFIVLVQLLLFLVHGFVYWTWLRFSPAPDPVAGGGAKIAVVVLSVSFVASSILAFRVSQFWVRWFYTMAAVWLGIVNFLFLAACACWVAYAVTALSHIRVQKQSIAQAFYGCAVCVSGYALINARILRVRHIRVKLPHLPPVWQGRVAALVSDMHLGHVRGRGFTLHIVKSLNRLRPDIVFIPGDLFDGTAADLDRVTQPWSELAAPLGAYFTEGNHEEFRDNRQYLDAVCKFGIRVLHNEKVSVEGLDILGVPYRTIVRPAEFQSALSKIGVDHNRASILLAHAPDHLKIAEEAGVSLELCGHTHRGQFFPWTMVTARLYGKFVYGLHPLGNLWVYTTTGAGTWGPPVRLGAPPEIVLIHFD